MLPVPTAEFDGGYCFVDAALRRLQVGGGLFWRVEEGVRLEIRSGGVGCGG